MVFWQDGFTLEPSRELRRYEDPRSRTLLEAIQAGRVPLSELGVRPDQPVEMRVAHRADEPYSPEQLARLLAEMGGRQPAPVFAGTGRRLGDLADPVAAAAPRAAAAPAASVNTVDAARPTTRIQFRLADGSRHTIAFNTDQTVGDIYHAVDQLTGRRTALLSGRPPAPLPDDRSQTIQAAGLAGSLVTQQ